jgi:endonuclease-3
LSSRRAADAVMTIVRSYGDIAPDFDARGPFEVLVATILSQNTNARNARHALANLRRGRRLSPRRIRRMTLTGVESKIRVSGLHGSKARSIKAAADYIQNKYGGDMHEMLQQDPESLRKELITIRGVGPKTADIILAFCARVPTVPVDTHIARISARLGLVGPNAKYDQIKNKLERVIPEKRRLAGHLALINFGREICLARKPRCQICPVRRLCPYYSALIREIRRS